MNTKRILTAIAATLAITFGASAQNMTQQQANQYLVGTWNAGGKTLTIAANGSARSANIYGQDFNYWSIYTNTFNFATGSLQATNNNPQRNITVKYRNLTQSSCEFLIDGNWVSASKGGSAQRPVQGTVQRPVSNGNSTVRPVSNGNVQKPAQATVQRPTNNNVQRSVTNTNNATRTVPSNNVQRPTQGTIQLPANNKRKLTRPTSNGSLQRPANKTNNGTGTTDNSQKQHVTVTTSSQEETPQIIN